MAQLNIQVSGKLRARLRGEAKALSTPTVRLTTKAMLCNLVEWFLSRPQSEKANIAYGSLLSKTTEK